MGYYAHYPEQFTFEHRKEKPEKTRDYIWAIRIEEKESEWNMELLGFHKSQFITELKAWETGGHPCNKELLTRWPLRPVDNPFKHVLEKSEVVLGGDVSDVEVFEVFFEFENSQTFTISSETRVTNPELIPSEHDEIWDARRMPQQLGWTKYIEQIVETYGFHISNIFIVVFTQDSVTKIGWFSEGMEKPPILLQHLAVQIVFKFSVVGLSPSMLTTQQNKLASFFDYDRSDGEDEQDFPNIQIISFGTTQNWWWRRRM